MTGIVNTLVYFLGILILYYLIPPKNRWGILLLASVVFYAIADWKMLSLLGGSILFSYAVGLKVEKAEGRKKRAWLITGIALETLILISFKYFHFFTGAVTALMGKMGLFPSSGVLNLLMPLGISYYTFKNISYLADVHQGKISAEKHLGHYALYVSFFLQIVCGPIERADNFLPQIKSGCRYDEKMAAEGVERMLIGLFKKLAIADRLAPYIGTIFGAPEQYPGLASLMAVCLFSVQIYCDFSGYSDMAIGMAQILGIRTRENFCFPYFSRGIKEFWSRWHKSLSCWLKDYIYIPLGGNRKGKFRKRLNIIATFLVSGIWHGESINFMIWGLLHGVWSAFAVKKGKDAPMWRQIWQMLVTFAGVTFTWIFFRAKDLQTSVTMIKKILFEFGFSAENVVESILPFTGDNTCAAYFLVNVLLILMIAVFEWRKSRGKRTGYIWLAGMLMVTMLFGIYGNSSFLYGQF